MSNQTFSFTVTLNPSTSTSTLHPSPVPAIEMARPLEPGSSSSYYLPPPQTQEGLRLTRQIGVSIESDSPLSIQISSPCSPVKTFSHPPPITHPHSPPLLNIPTSLPHRIPRDVETEEDVIRSHLHTFMSHCQHELDILETRRRDALHLYKDTLVHDRLSEKYDKMWDMLTESRKLLGLLSE